MGSVTISCVAAVCLVAAPAAAQPYSDEALLQQLGVLAGQAVACRLDTPDIASAVALRSADAMGYGDATTRQIIEGAAEKSRAEGCIAPDRERAAAFWATIKRRVGL